MLFEGLGSLGALWEHPREHIQRAPQDQRRRPRRWGGGGVAAAAVVGAAVIAQMPVLVAVAMVQELMGADRMVPMTLDGIDRGMRLLSR